MASLPTPGGDANSWGTMLNDYLQQALASDGTLVTGATNSYTSNPNTNLASGSQPGLVQLTGDLGNTAVSPQVTNLHLSGDTSIGHKLTNLTNGSSAQDAAAYGQIPTALPPNGSAGGDLSGSYPSPTVAKVNGVQVANNAVTVSSNAGTCSAAYRLNTFTNSSAATMAITLGISTPTPVDGQLMLVRIYDFSAAAETIGWTNTENSTVTAPTTSNGSTTLPLTVAFQFNSQTTKWRCVGYA